MLTRLIKYQVINTSLAHRETFILDLTSVKGARVQHPDSSDCGYFYSDSIIKKKQKVQKAQSLNDELEEITEL